MAGAVSLAYHFYALSDVTARWASVAEVASFLVGKMHHVNVVFLDSGNSVAIENYVRHHETFSYHDPLQKFLSLLRCPMIHQQ